MSEVVLQPDAAALSVSIGFPTGLTLPWPTALSLARTTHACARRGIEVDIDFVCGSSIITVARSLVAHRFLQSNKKKLFWIDSDIEWEPDDFLRLLGLSGEMDVVCTSYPLKREENSGFVVYTEGAEKTELNKFGCIKISGTGLGFCVMDRKVVERVAETKPKILNQGSGDTMADIFRIDTIDGKLRGEDMAFFEDIQKLGYDIWLDPTIQLGHIGSKTYRGNLVKAFGLEQYFQKASK